MADVVVQTDLLESACKDYMQNFNKIGELDEQIIKAEMLLKELRNEHRFCVGRQDEIEEEINTILGAIEDSSEALKILELYTGKMVVNENLTI